MKNTRFVLTLLVLFSVGLAFAHPASVVTATFDKAKGNLSINFEHKVKDVSDHFVYDVKVAVNKKVVISQKIARQENNVGGSLYYRLPDINPGDKITVTTDCNKGGKKSASVDVK